MERGRSQVWLSLVAVSLLASTLMGCGGSSTNWADAARRGRSEDEFGGYSNNATANTTADDAEATTTENNVAAATGASSQEVATQPEPDSGVADLSTLALPSGVADGDEDSLGDYLERMNAIGKAFAQEMSATSHMPRTWERDSDGDPGLSWRVRILPLLGHQELYDKFKLDEPWDSPHNIQLVRYMPGEFRSGSTEVGKTCFQLPIATYTPFPPGGLPVKVVDISHGMGATIMMVQTKPERAVFWTAPTDYIPPERNNADGLALSKENTYLVLWGSGQAEEIKSDVGANLYHCMFTARGPADVFDPLAVAAHPPAAPAGPGSTSEVGPEAVVSTGASVETPTARPAEPTDLASKLHGFTLERMANGEFEYAAELLQLEQLISLDAVPTGQWAWLPAVGGLRESPRIGMGITCAVGGRISSANPVKGQFDDSPYRWQDVSSTTGDVGQAVINRIMARIDAGALGANQLPPAKPDGTRDARRGGQTDSRFLAAGFEYVGNDGVTKLIEIAKYRNLDLLIHVDCELGMTRQNYVTNTATLRIYDVRTRRPLFESSDVNNVRVQLSRNDLSIENPLNKMQVELQQYCDANLAFDRSHDLTIDEARALVALDSFDAERPDWTRALECRELFRRGLISRVEYEQAFAAACCIDWQAYQNTDDRGRMDLLLGKQDSSVALAAVESLEWIPQPLRPESSTAAGGASEAGFTD
ncbi:MAG: DUF1559 domain-containing protein [Planctomycetales bacterium]|nr:DUF1559 domain-containing protein [Planctomycetales bacterium]